jgi:GNAT superfamily N-acetyltransferase
MIKDITFEQITDVWKTELWLNRTSKITEHSSMMLRGGFDISYHNTTAHHWGIFNDDTIIAVLSGHPTDSNFRIRGLWVDSDFRGRGIAGVLFKNAEEVAKTYNSKLIWTYPRNSSLHSYCKYGFSITQGPIEDLTEKNGPYWYVVKDISYE